MTGPRLTRIEMLLLGVSLLVAIAYFARVPQNPGGFFVDEASIAYNAHTISSRGVDEYGHSFPLYFRAFGEYKSPVYIYALAGIFKFMGRPSIFVARAFSAFLGLATALLLGVLAYRISGRRDTALIVFISTGLTPWFFEISRLVFEVTLLPVLLVIFLILIHTASRRDEWPWPIPTAIGLLLGLMVYTYPGGRLLAALLALGLVLFLTRRRWRAVVLAFVIFGLTLVPLVIFTKQNPEALGERFKYVTYIKPGDTPTQIAGRFAQNYVNNFSPRSWLLRGDPEPRHHLPGMGSLLAGVAILTLLGLILALVEIGRDAWWRFVIFGLVVSPIPASLTLDHFHTLRLIALPVFVLILTVPAIKFLQNKSPGWPTLRRAALATLVVAIILQGALFQWRFHTSPPRVDAFDSYYPELLVAALNQPERPIYLVDKTPAAYMYAFWYATVRGVGIENFHRIPRHEPPPPGVVVISHDLPCSNCEMIAERGQFRVYRQK